MKMFEFPAFLVLSLIDKGYKESIEDVVELCEDKKIFTYLGEKYNNENISNFARKEETENYLQEFVRTFTTGDFQRKFHIENNGLVLIVSALVDS
ncbi:hypothetical protein [Lysinibacillus xylanilyticus]|uniref:hypothetical protein n=1 Tax=Lysinibacillus xylanilyticus TaxID=582475 RepID=UPI003818869D